ncbi:MAG: glycosyl hydrolase 53 family protein [Chitinophagaceae bacterium]
MKNKIWMLFLMSICIAASCKKNKSTAQVPPVTPPLATVAYRGADLSFIPEIETTPTIYYNSNGQAQDALTILKNSGMNIVRLRLWHSPANGNSGLAQVEAFAQRIKAAGLQWWLDIHYSDTWADPGQQTPPAAWQAASYANQLDSVYNYTYSVMNDLKNKNILPIIVQVGNETNSGMLWNIGKVGGSFDANWPQYAGLVKKGILAVKTIDPSIKVMLHFAGTNGASWFYNNLQTQGVNYDIIGLSYYHWWHNRNLSELQTDLTALANTFNKDIFIAETAYPFSLGWNDYTNNIFGSSTTLLPGYDASPAGQLKFLSDLRTVIAAVPNNHGLGFCYWEPAWVAYRGNAASNGSPWENLALFDFNNKALAALAAYTP